MKLVLAAVLLLAPAACAEVRPVVPEAHITIDHTPPPQPCFECEPLVIYET